MSAQPIRLAFPPAPSPPPQPQRIKRTSKHWRSEYNCADLPGVSDASTAFHLRQLPSLPLRKPLVPPSSSSWPGTRAGFSSSATWSSSSSRSPVTSSRTRGRPCPRFISSASTSSATAVPTTSPATDQDAKSRRATLELADERSFPTAGVLQHAVFDNPHNLRLVVRSAMLYVVFDGNGTAITCYAIIAFKTCANEQVRDSKGFTVQRARRRRLCGASTSAHTIQETLRDIQRARRQSARGCGASRNSAIPETLREIQRARRHRARGCGISTTAHAIQETLREIQRARRQSAGLRHLNDSARDSGNSSGKSTLHISFALKRGQRAPFKGMELRGLGRRRYSLARPRPRPSRP